MATQTQLAALDAMHRTGIDTYERIGAAELERMVPVFRPGVVKAGLIDRASADIDVDTLHQRYLRGLRGAQGQIKTDARFRGASAVGGAWRLSFPDGEIRCRILLNAAGAWGDQVAASAGVATVGLQPKRRTAALVDAPSAPGFKDWPRVIGAGFR